MAVAQHVDLIGRDLYPGIRHIVRTRLFANECKVPPEREVLESEHDQRSQ